MKKHTTRSLRNFKKLVNGRSLQMLTCYDYQTAQLFNELPLDLVLVGDSVGNVILGHETTVEVTLEEMITFTSAVKRGAPNRFVVGDMPFGTYSTFEDGVKNATKLFQTSKVESIKLEGAFPHHLEIIKRVTESGIPVMGHIGLTPQSVHQQGGYYIHGKDEASANRLVEEAIKLEEAGTFAIVLECVKEDIAKKITQSLSIPTIGIGSGDDVDGQVLVTNDLLKMGPGRPPKFCTPIADFFQLKKNLLEQYLATDTASTQELRGN